MYKFLGALFCAVLLLFCCPKCDFLGSVTDLGEGEVYFCVSQDAALSGVTTIQNGNGYILRAPGTIARRVQNLLDTDVIQGIVYFTQSSVDTAAYLDKISAHVCFEERVEQNHFLYAYSSKFPRYITYKGQRINIQISITSAGTTIGYPLILTGA